MPKSKIISWNVNGIRAAVRKGFHDWLKTENPDILCIQETKAHPEQLDEHLLSGHGYKTYWHSAQKKGYSGVAVFTKKEPLKVIKGMGIEKFDAEGRMLHLQFKDFDLLNIYFPNGKRNTERLQYKMDYYTAHFNYVKKLQQQGRKVIVCGDYNTAHKEIDLARPKDNETISGFLPEERAWIDKYVAAGFIDTFREFSDKAEQYTWWSMRTRARQRNVGWRIDYFFIDTTSRKHLKDAFILSDVQGSDHCPLGIVMEF